MDDFTYKIGIELDETVIQKEVDSIKKNLSEAGIDISKISDDALQANAEKILYTSQIDAQLKALENIHTDEADMLRQHLLGYKNNLLIMSENELKLKEIEDELEQLKDKDDEKSKLLKDELEQKKRELKSVVKNEKHRKKLQSLNDKLSENLDEQLADLKKQLKNDFSGPTLTDMYKSVKNAAKKVMNSVVDLFKSAVSTLNEAATYDLSNSRIVNSQARDQALEYGLSDSQNYAFSNVKDIMGISSQEDLMMMNDRQRETFQELMQWYGDKYNEWQESGILKDMQDFAIESKKFKLEMQAKVIQFFTKNESLIRDTFNELIEATPTMLKVFSAIMNVVTAIGDYLFDYSYDDDDRTNASNETIQKYISENTTNMSENATKMSDVGNSAGVSKTSNTVVNQNVTMNAYTNDASVLTKQVNDKLYYGTLIQK